MEQAIFRLKILHRKKSSIDVPIKDPNHTSESLCVPTPWHVCSKWIYICLGVEEESVSPEAESGFKRYANESEVAVVL